jgi:probable F420-dependent oxidoreductase
MDHGVVMFPTEYSIAPDEFARALEERGFESVWFPEHTHIPVSRQSAWPGGGDLPREYWSAYDPFVALMAAAGATKRLRLGTGICLVIERDPIVTAKEIATLDRLSGGRVLFGIGGGWNAEEMANHGTAWKSRWRVLRERVLAMKAIWTQREASYQGEFVRFERIWSEPKPLQKPHPPVMNAGGSPAAQDFTTRHCDMNFVILKDRTFLDGARKQIAHLKEMARARGRETRIWIHVYVVCRETEKEAKDYLHRYVYEQGDWEAAGNLLHIFGMQTETLDNKTLDDHKAHFIAGHGGYPLVGTAEQITDELCKLADIGVDGCLISWVDYKSELKQWNAEVLPLLEQAGIRQPFRSTQKQPATSDTT